MADMTPQDIADVMNGANITKPQFAGMMARLGALDNLNKLRSKRALLVAEHQSIRQAQDAALGELDTEIAAAVALADSVVGR